MRDPRYPETHSAPIVLQLTDDNADGLIGAGDIPDVVFTHSVRSGNSVLTALDGRDGSDIFTTTTEVAPMAPAGGDLDGDGVVELVAFAGDGLAAFRHDGTFAWTKPEDIWYWQSVGIADFDQDGSPEIYLNASVHASDGTLRWRGTGGIGTPDGGVGTSTAVDLLPSSRGLELVAGNTCYAADGTILWHRADLRDGLASVGDLDGDGSGEVVLVTFAEPSEVAIQVLNRGGASLAPPLVFGCDSVASATLADLDGDGRLEVLIQMQTGCLSSLNAYQWTGAELSPYWSLPVAESSGLPTASVFDVDGDGAPEVLYAGGGGLLVVNGASGAVIDQAGSRVSGHQLAAPVVVDVDADGFPEIVVSSEEGGFGFVTAYECGTATPARCTWNQFEYHVTNVNDDGTIPRVETPPWLAGLGSRQQEAQRCCGSSVLPRLPDVVICAGGNARLDAAALDPGCSGAIWEWRDDTGSVIGNTPTVTVSPATSTTYHVSVGCPLNPACDTTATVSAILELPPLLDTASLVGRDPDPCNIGLELSWAAATFRDPSGSGTYDVYRSDTNCLDAITHPPVATGLTGPPWVDGATRSGRAYFYVVQAEDARTSTPCPQGPHNGGAVNAGVACIGPILESPEAYTPELLGLALRAEHVGDAVTMSWPTSRALLPGEHFHVLKAYDALGFVMVNAEGDRATSWTETDRSRRLQFFDVRIANPCEILSLDDEPPG